MKKLLFLTMLLSTAQAFSIEAVENITCALKTKKVSSRSTSAKAKKVIQFTLIGEVVYRMTTYEGRYFAKTFTKKTFGSGLVDLEHLTSEGEAKLPNRRVLSGDLMSLTENVSTGSYSGAGRSSNRVNKYVCLTDYDGDMLTITREELAKDFGLL